MRKKSFILFALGTVALVPLLLALPGREFSEIAPPSQGSKSPRSNLPLPVDPKLPRVISEPPITNSIPRLSAQMDVSQLKRGLDRLTSRDVTSALAIRDTLPAKDIDRQILTWAIAMSGQSAIPSNILSAALSEIGDLPGQVTIRSNYERSLLREGADEDQILSLFDQQAPITIDGKLAYSKALMAKKRPRDAEPIIRELWNNEILNAEQENDLTSLWPSLSGDVEQQRRFFMLAYRGRMQDAERFAEKAKALSLFKAWKAVAARSKDAGAAIKAISPEWQSHPAVLYLQVRQHRQQSNYSAAAKLLEQVTAEQIAQSAPSAWWTEMRVVARGLLDSGNAKRAYNLIAAHPPLEDAEAADAEFHAGWLALRYNKMPERAQAHFRKMLSHANDPISKAKAQYWLGRSLESSNRDSALQHFALAAKYPASYYGQLANQRLGNRFNPIELPAVSDDDRILLAGRPLMHAIERLERAGYAWRADILYRTLANTLDRAGEVALLANRLEERGAHQVSLQVGRAAFNRGVDQAALAFPIGAIPSSAEIGDTGKALAFAIARQESAFDVAAISPANAQGLLQILPGTAKEVAERINVEFNPARLTSDAAYNAQLGAQYLSEQISRFDGSYILTFIAYNAGPRRVDEWVKKYGDPRKLKLDEIVDWIERIPFPETRNYVQRVMENYQVYKARLGQEADIEHDLTLGRPS